MTYLPWFDKSNVYLSRQDTISNPNVSQSTPLFATDKKGDWVWVLRVTGNIAAPFTSSVFRMVPRWGPNGAINANLDDYSLPINSNNNFPINWGIGYYATNLGVNQVYDFLILPSNINPGGSLTVSQWLFFIPTSANRGV